MKDSGQNHRTVSAEGRKPHLLLVDDDPASLELLVDIAGLCGVELFTAASGAQALKVIHDQPLDLAIVDLRLPDLSGVEVLEALRKVHPDSMRMLITAYNDFGAAARAVNRVGIYHILIKPVKADYVTSVIRRALDHRETEWERARLEARLLQVNRQLESELKKRTRAARQYSRDLVRTRGELERTFWELVHFSRFSSLGLMTGVLAHDMRNPLSVLSGQLQILAMKTPEGDPLTNRVQVMTRQVSRIQDLVDGVACMAQNDPRSQRLFPPDEALEEALTLTRKLFSTRNLEVRREPGPGKVKVLGNFSQWVHVFFKLLEFIGSRIACAGVEVQVLESPEEARVLIRYPEPALPPRIKRAITAKRMPVRSVSRPEVISFYLCARILENTGGQLQIYREKGRTVFAVVQPVAQEKVEAVEEAINLG
jgi:ActR/RegA family two-component response regulator